MTLFKQHKTCYFLTTCLHIAFINKLYLGLLYLYIYNVITNAFDLPCGGPAAIGADFFSQWIPPTLKLKRCSGENPGSAAACADAGCFIPYALLPTPDWKLSTIRVL